MRASAPQLLPFQDRVYTMPPGAPHLHRPTVKGRILGVALFSLSGSGVIAVAACAALGHIGAAAELFCGLVLCLSLLLRAL